MMGGMNHMSTQGVPTGIRPSQMLPDQQQQQQQYLRQQQQQMLRVSGAHCTILPFLITGKPDVRQGKG